MIKHYLAGYYEESLDKLEMYQRLIQYWGFLFDKRNELSVLDNMNFSLQHYPELLKTGEVLAIHDLESGYTSPDGSGEIGAIIRRFEYLRLQRHSPHREKLNKELTDKAGIGCGNGTSNVMMALMNVISRLPKDVFPRANDKPEIALVLPNYTVYAAQSSHMKPAVTPRFIHAKAENGFLATYDDVVNAITPNTIALVITYPNNPTQSTYEGTRLVELKKIVDFCQKEGVFLIVDNVYQELVYGDDRQFEEVFAQTDKLDYVIKVYGQSKDTPFFAGYRTGYWFGDPRIQNAYRYQISAGENSMNLLSLAMFGFNMMLRSLEYAKESLTVDHMQYLEGGMFGWSQKIDRQECFERFQQTGLAEKFKSRLAQSNQIQRDAVRQVREFVAQSKGFSGLCNENIGNVCFLNVNNKYYGGSDAELFDFLFERKIGILPGNVFGLPIQRGECWFRMTLVHESATNLVQFLDKIDHHLTAR
jgi:aspartate/methionine/tyrosine aminotransferase